MSCSIFPHVDLDIYIISKVKQHKQGTEFLFLNYRAYLDLPSYESHSQKKYISKGVCWCVKGVNLASEYRGQVNSQGEWG